MLTRALGASMSAAQLTMSALILAFGLGQMFWGPVADRVGRRPVLLTGLVMYTAASVGGALAGSIEALVVWRVLQGAAMAAAVVCARAIVRDLYEPVEGAQVMALALSGLGLIALAGPLAGGTAALWFGWRGALAVVAAVGALTLAFIAWKLPETLLHKNPRATQPGPLLRAWWDIGRHPVFLAWGLLVGCTYGGLFTILAASSFVYMDVLGLSPTAYGGVMALGSLSYLGSTFVCRRWITRLGMAGAVRRGRLVHAGRRAAGGCTGGGRCAHHLGGAAAAVPVPDGPWHPPALRASGCGGALPAPRRRGLGVWPGCCWR
jgi:DHA1 family bicyclomycin/chloramphenicol resistance-like MFS transporter